MIAILEDVPSWQICIVDIISLGRREKSLAGYKGTLSSVGRGDHQISNEGCLTC